MQRLGIFLLLFIFACKGKTVPEHSTDLTCVNSFIRCIYEGRFDDAEKIMTPDEASRKCLQQSRFNYNQVMTKEIKTKYKYAAATLKKEAVNDSISIFICEDVISGDSKPFKAVRQNNEWKVDFSYTCSGNL